MPGNNLLLNLPSQLRTLLIAEWLCVNDLSSLEVALMKKAQREEFWSQLHNDHTVLQGTPRIRSDGNLLSCLKWLVKRGLSVRSLRFSINDPVAEVKYVLYQSLLHESLTEVGFDKLDGIDIELFRLFVLSCRGLTKLDISFCGGLTDVYLRHIGCGEASSKDEPLSSANNHSDEIISSTNSNDSDSSRHVTVGSGSEGCTCSPNDLGGSVILSNLRTVLLNNCVNLTDLGIVSLCQLAPALTKVHCRGVPRLSDASLVALAQLPQLKDIDVALCRLLSDRGVQAFATTPSANSLDTLNLYYCRGVSDAGIVALTQRHTNLRALTLSGCHLLTDLSLERIASQAQHHLQYLHLANCVKITSLGIQSLAQYCTQLTVLNLAHVKKVDDTAVRALWQQCEHLEEVSLKECDKVTDAAFAGHVVWLHLRLLDVSYCTQVILSSPSTLCLDN